MPNDLEFNWLNKVTHNMFFTLRFAKTFFLWTNNCFHKAFKTIYNLKTT